MARRDKPGIGKAELTRQLGALGVQPGGILLVHAAFSNVAPVEGGVHGLIEALRAAVGAEGTLVMPSMADDDDIPFDRRLMPSPRAARTPRRSRYPIPSKFRMA